MTEPMDFSMFSDMELVQVMHDLRTHPEDKVHLDAALKELATRQKAKMSAHLLNVAAQGREK